MTVKTAADFGAEPSKATNGDLGDRQREDSLYFVAVGHMALC